MSKDKHAGSVNSQSRKEKRVTDFSFVQLVETLGNERAPSQDDTCVRRVDTISSYNVRQDSERSNRHRPFPSSYKRKISEIDISPQKLAMKSARGVDRTPEKCNLMMKRWENNVS